MINCSFTNPLDRSQRKCGFIAEPNSVSGLEIDSMTTTSLMVKWATPAGQLTGYIVTLDDGSGSDKTKTPGEDETSAEFTGLTAGKEYTVRVVTMSGSAKSAIAEGQFYTSKSNGCFCGVWTKVHQDKTPQTIAAVLLKQPTFHIWLVT